MAQVSDDTQIVFENGLQHGSSSITGQGYMECTRKRYLSGIGTTREITKSNCVMTAFYVGIGWLRILPDLLLVIFTQFANIILLIFGIFQCIPQFTISSGIPSSILSLILIVMVTGFKLIVSNLSRLHADNKSNRRAVRVLTPGGKNKIVKDVKNLDPEDQTDYLAKLERKRQREEKQKEKMKLEKKMKGEDTIEIEPIFVEEEKPWDSYKNFLNPNIILDKHNFFFKWDFDNDMVLRKSEDLRIGDIILLSPGEEVSADCLIIDNTNDAGICYVESSQLDGESHLKLKEMPLMLKNLAINKGKGNNILFSSYHLLSLEYGLPDGDIEFFEGEITLNGEKTKSTISNYLLRKLSVQGNVTIIALVTTVGKETKLELHLGDGAAKKEIKTGMAYKVMMRLNSQFVIIIFVVVIILLILHISVPIFKPWLDQLAKQFEGPDTDLGSTNGQGVGGAIWYYFQSLVSSLLIFFNVIPTSLFGIVEVLNLFNLMRMTRDRGETAHRFLRDELGNIIIDPYFAHEEAFFVKGYVDPTHDPFRKASGQESPLSAKSQRGSVALTELKGDALNHEKRTLAFAEFDEVCHAQENFLEDVNKHQDPHQDLHQPDSVLAAAVAENSEVNERFDARINNPNVMQDLAISHVVSDKTGTLTQNKMIFRGLSIGDGLVIYGLGDGQAGEGHSSGGGRPPPGGPPSGAATTATMNNVYNHAGSANAIYDLLSYDILNEERKKGFCKIELSAITSSKSTQKADGFKSSLSITRSTGRGAEEAASQHGGIVQPAGLLINNTLVDINNPINPQGEALERLETNPGMIEVMNSSKFYSNNKAGIIKQSMVNFQSVPSTDDGNNTFIFDSENPDKINTAARQLLQLGRSDAISTSMLNNQTLIFDGHHQSNSMSFNTAAKKLVEPLLEEMSVKNQGQLLGKNESTFESEEQDNSSGANLGNQSLYSKLAKTGSVELVPQELETSGGTTSTIGQSTGAIIGDHNNNSGFLSASSSATMSRSISRSKKKHTIRKDQLIESMSMLARRTQTDDYGNTVIIRHDRGNAPNNSYSSPNTTLIQYLLNRIRGPKTEHDFLKRMDFMNFDETDLIRDVMLGGASSTGVIIDDTIVNFPYPTGLEYYASVVKNCESTKRISQGMLMAPGLIQQKGKDLLLAIALNNDIQTCQFHPKNNTSGGLQEITRIPLSDKDRAEGKSDQDREALYYFGTSPDELAFVSFASELGLTFTRRELAGTGVSFELSQEPVFDRIFNQGESIKKLIKETGELINQGESIKKLSNKSNKSNKTADLIKMFGFDSTRKRMSVVVRVPQDPPGYYRMFCKGADTSILPYCQKDRTYNIYKQLCEEKSGTKIPDVAIKESSYQEYLKLQDLSAPFTAAEDALDAYSAKGWRTLSFSQKLIKDEDWNSFLKKFESIGPRIRQEQQGEKKLGEKQILKLIEMEETALIQSLEETVDGFEYLGCTALEDVLQEGLESTLLSLRDAGITLWVLTGDKVETAIAIALSCNLVTRTMTRVVLNNVYMEGLRSAGKDIIEELTRIERQDVDFNTTENNALVIDGSTVAELIGSNAELTTAFLKFLKGFRVLIACRVTPRQKAELTAVAQFLGLSDKEQERIITVALADVQKFNEEMKLRSSNEVNLPPVNPDHERLVTHPVFTSNAKLHGRQVLAIGDGANDAPMIERANIGIGIRGKEGGLAAMVADINIGRFRDLERLIFIYGHESHRTFFLACKLQIARNVHGFGVICWIGLLILHGDISTPIINDMVTSIVLHTLSCHTIALLASNLGLEKAASCLDLIPLRGRFYRDHVLGREYMENDASVEKYIDSDDEYEQEIALIQNTNHPVAVARLSHQIQNGLVATEGGDGGAGGIGTEKAQRLSQLMDDKRKTLRGNSTIEVLKERGPAIQDTEEAWFKSDQIVRKRSLEQVNVDEGDKEEHQALLQKTIINSNRTPPNRPPKKNCCEIHSRKRRNPLTKGCFPIIDWHEREPYNSQTILFFTLLQVFWGGFARYIIFYGCSTSILSTYKITGVPISLTTDGEYHFTTWGMSFTCIFETFFMILFGWPDFRYWTVYGMLITFTVFALLGVFLSAAQEASEFDIGVDKNPVTRQGSNIMFVLFEDLRGGLNNFCIKDLPNGFKDNYEYLENVGYKYKDDMSQKCQPWFSIYSSNMFISMFLSIIIAVLPYWIYRTAQIILTDRPQKWVFRRYIPRQVQVMTAK